MKNSCFYPEISSILNHSRRSIYSSNHLTGLINSSKFLKNKDLEDYYSSNIRIDKDTTFIHVQDFFEGGTQLLALSFAKYLQSMGKNVMVLTQDDTGYLSNEFERFKICYLKIDLNDISAKFKLMLGVENSHTLISFSSVNLLALIEYQKLGMDCFLSFNEPFEMLGQETLEIFLTFLKSGKCFFPYFNPDFIKFLAQRDIPISDENSQICRQIRTGIPFLTNTTLNYSKSNKKAFLEKFDIKPGSLILGSLASGIFRKGFDRLESILENCESDTYFLWVGKVDLNLLNKFPKNLILIDDLPSGDFFDIIDIYCCLSRNDVYPMSVTESLIRNIPIISFDSDSCGQNNFSSNELITEGDGSSERFSQLINDFRYTNNKPEPSLNNLVFTGEHSRGYFFQKMLKSMGTITPSVSVVLPYYNHFNFSFERLESILMQDMPVNEIVMLNDGSTDQGFELYRSLSKSNLDYKFKVIENESNQGNVFQQWIKGIDESTSDYIWIAETDDFSHPTFTLELLQALSKESVTFASCDSIHISDDGKIIANRNPHFEESNLKSFSFETPFIVSGNTLIEQSLGIYNCIPNVSACLFKTKFLKKAIHNISSDLISLKYAGDWLLYLELATMGDVAYSPLKLNYFTKSNHSTIGASDKNRLIDEIALVQQRAQQKGFHSEKFLQSQNNYLSEVNRLRVES
jgi:glycosyltransferase involved in cell wall biosynthesis